MRTGDTPAPSLKITRRAITWLTGWIGVLVLSGQLISLTTDASDCLKNIVTEIAGGNKSPSPINSEEIAQALTTYRSKILEGYRLPLNYSSSFYARRIEPYLSRQRFPEVVNPEVLYRGMFVSMDDLIKLVREGHPLDKVNWTAVGGKGVSFSSSLSEARTYIFHAADGRAEGIGVIFEVKKRDYMTLIDDPINNQMRTIYKAFRDVPPEDVVDIHLWGQYGPEDIRSVLKEAAEGKIRNHSEWTNSFDNLTDH